MDRAMDLGKYLLLEPLGSGGMGTVYRAFHKDLGREVALKVVREDLLSSPGSKARFRREAQALAQLKHENIARVFDFESNGAIDYIVMELIEGRSLRDLLREEPPSIETVAGIADQVLAGLQAAHEAGIVHRDIKPENILITPEGQVKLLDFGLAKALGLPPDAPTITAWTAGFVGTPAYAAPEQKRNAVIDHRVDLYSVGAVLFEALTGSRATETHHSPRDLNPRIPTRVEDVILRSLEEDPDKRQSSAAEMQRELRAACRRRRWPFLGAAGLAGALSVAGILLWPHPDRLIAVLPVLAQGIDQEVERLSTDLTADLIAQLHGYDGIRVLSSYTGYRIHEAGGPRSPQVDSLGVDYLLAGRLSREESTVRVWVEAIDPADGSVKRASVYEAPSDSLRGLSIRIAKDAADLFGGRAAPEGRALPIDSAAYEAYSRGRQVWQFTEWNEETIRDAIRHYEEALRISPEFPAALAGLAAAYNDLMSMDIDRAANHRRSVEYAEQALVLDPTLPDAHAVLASNLWNPGLDWAGAQRELAMAEQMDPGNAVLLYYQTAFQALTGRREEAVETVHRWLTTDPLNYRAQTQNAWVLHEVGRYQEARAASQALMVERPNDRLVHLMFAWSCACAGDYDSAYETYDRLGIAPEAWVVARSGRLPAIEERIAVARDSAAAGDVEAAFFLGEAYAAAGEPDLAMPWLERAVEGRARGIQWLLADCSFDPIRSDPRFQDLLRRAGFPESRR